ncbi:MAG: LuxR C-terminal-related transcriptional regulator [Clostridia bacterium]|nr:LuxR C-terminal-related transcriptional regulator [Clostridia bacterium]
MVANQISPNRIFDFNIDLEKMLERPRINQLMLNGLTYPLTIVHAPAGYGKTTAALQFAKGVKGQIVYMVLNELDKNLQYFWEHLSTLYTQISSQTGAKMAQMGFPSTSGLFLQFADLFKEVSLNEKHILIIDDFHVAECAELEELLVKISGLRLKDIHILILSRTSPKLCSVDLKVKGLLFEITKEHLRFDSEEILGYYKFYDIEITAPAVEKIGSFTEGWASAVYLSSLYFRQNPDNLFNIAIFDIDRLIENTIYKGYDREVREFLLKLSILDRFDTEICSYLTGNKNAYELLSRVLNENSLIKISEDRQFFEMHRLFRDFLQKRLASHSSIDKNTLHIRAGEYYDYKSDILMALMHLDHAREYEKMANLIIKNKCTTTFSTQELVSILHYMHNIPKEYYLKHPMLLLISAMSLTRTKHASKSLELLAEVEQLCADSEMPAEVKKKLLGEAAVIKALMSFNDTTKMLLYFKEACTLLPGGTELVGANWSYTFGSPSVLYLYYNRVGGLDGMLDEFMQGFPYWERLSSCGCGANYLLRAEVAFERCDYENAEQDAYRAIFRAEEKQQNSIVIAAKLLIIKICATRGKYSNAVILMRDMRELMNYRKALIYLSTMDMCTAVFNLLAGDNGNMPGWLLDGELTASAANRAGFGIEFLIYAQILLNKQEYIKIESIIPKMFDIYSMFNNQYGIIRTHLITALADFHLYGPEKAVASLNVAFAITEADRLTMPYLEYGEYLLPVFKAFEKNHDNLDVAFSGKWLEDIIKKMKKYQNAISRFRAGFNAVNYERITGGKGKVRLTKRETEILRLIVEGFSGEEIAKRLYVTPINVRVITSKIYTKLGVSSRVEAVKKTIENGLLEVNRPL